MAARGIPPARRLRASFPSSMAATMPRSFSSAAAESWDIADRPRMYIFYVRRNGKARTEPPTANSSSIRSPLGVRSRECAFTRKQAAKTQQNEPGLTQTYAPQNLPGFIPRIATQRLLGRRIQQVHELAVIGLLKIVQ